MKTLIMGLVLSLSVVSQYAMADGENRDIAIASNSSTDFLKKYDSQIKAMEEYTLSVESSLTVKGDRAPAAKDRSGMQVTLIRSKRKG